LRAALHARTGRVVNDLASTLVPHTSPPCVVYGNFKICQES
jgi:hypothetical protein